MQTVLEIELSDHLELDDYLSNLNRMFGKARLDEVVGSVYGEIRFSGLFKTGMNLKGIDRHLKLLESYKKLQKARAKLTSKD